MCEKITKHEKMNYAIIVAGGKGTRFGGDLPKQFLDLNGKVVLMRSIEAFYRYDKSIKIIVALPKLQIDFWKTLCDTHNFTIEHLIVEGGETRFHSVKNALSQVEGSGVVGIHDGVRPLVDKQTIENCYIAAANEGTAIPVVNVVDSIRKIDHSANVNKMVNRDNYKLVQTPQVFDIQVIKSAYLQEYRDCFTDDASVVEHYTGCSVNLVEGNRQNIKITTKEDLIYAEAIVKSRV